MTIIKPRKWTGKPVAMPGIVSGMPLSAYHSAECCIEPCISSSGLRKIYSPDGFRVASPRHYWDGSPYNPDRADDGDEKRAFILGQAAHYLILGESDFKGMFAVQPAVVNGETWHGNKNVCKAWLARQKENGLTVLTLEEMKHVMGIYRALAEEPLVQAGILNGAIEQSWFWKDTETGIWLRVRPDANPNDSLDFADLKLTRSIMWADLQRAIREYGYYQQAALVGTACLELLKRPMNSFSLVFIENKRPYSIVIVTLKDNDLKRGEQANRIALRRFADCWKAKRWPGPHGDQADARYIEIDQRSQERIDERLKVELGA